MQIGTNSQASPSSGDRLSRLLDQVDRRGVTSLSDAEVLELGRLYRRASSALSRARSRGLGGVESERLNLLVGRAYAHVYGGQVRDRATVAQFFLREFPRACQRQAVFFVAAVGLSLVAAALGYVLTRVDPQMPDVLLGPGWAEGLQGIAQRHAGVHNWMPEEARPVASSFIMVNNLRVAFLAFATGMLFGLGTLFVLSTNGLMLGAVAAVVQTQGVGANFWAFVAPHGVLELTAIFLSAAAGLMLGWAEVHPGRYGRIDALRLAAREAVKLILGVMAMLVVAGVIEAFVSPVPEIPNLIKYQFAALLGLSLYAYLFVTGRRARPHPEDRTRIEATAAPLPSTPGSG